MTSGETVLCVDDDRAVRELIERIISGTGNACRCVATAGDARRALSQHGYAVVLCDIDLPDESGLELLGEIAREHPGVATVMVTGSDDPELAERALELGAYGYLTKPFAANDLVIDVSNALHRRKLEAERRCYQGLLEERVAERTRQLENAYTETIARLGRAIDFYDGTTGAHVERVAARAEAIALALGLTAAEAARLARAGVLHDVGKIALSPATLRKPGPLTAAERAAVERHAEVGHELLAGSGNELLELAAVVALTHHERWDGAGYPRGLRGEEIPLAGRITAVADVYDALTSDRPYRAALGASAACRAIVSESGGAFDPAVVRAFLATMPAEVAA